MKRIISSNWFPLLVLFFFLALTFYRLPLTFFQQDEWRAFGISANFEQNFREVLKMLLPKTFFDHFNIASFLTEYLQFKLFRINFLPFALISLLFHFLNSLLVYYLILIISRKKSLSLMVSLIFITNSISHQAITWISASTSTQGATLFTLVSLVLFFKYLRDGQDRAVFLFLSLISFLVSLTFKESSIFLFIFFPIFWFLFAKGRTFPQFKKIILPLFLTFFLYVMFRGLFLFNNFEVENIGSMIEPGTKTVQTSISTYIYRIVDLPFKALPQSIFTTLFLVDLSNNLVLTAYPHWLVASDGAANPYVVESVAFDYISFVLSIFILLFAFFVYKLLYKTKDQNGIQLLKFSLVFIVISYFPFILIPGRGGYISIAEPRNLYMPGIGASIFLALIIYTLGKWLVHKKIVKSSLPVIAILLFLLIFMHIKNIWRDLKALEERSIIRKEILEKIISSSPNLTEKIVFYTESDTAYYGLPIEEKILPFQSGFGRTLLVWYYGNGEKIPSCFFKNSWLYYLDKDQGYKYCQGKGFGYFRKFESLERALKENNLSSENVIAFSWNSKNNTFEETTKQVRKKIKETWQNKK